MNYKHLYHAGNFADVAKHVALIGCLEALRRKPGAFFVLDTHAGRGEYDLRSSEALRSGEAERGVQRLIDRADSRPAHAAILAPYFGALRVTAGERLQLYAGSPLLIARGLRAQDRAVLVELDPAEARAAARRLESLGRVRVETGDGYAALRAQLPPRERRGLVLIDPPYERIDEIEVLVNALAQAWRRWPTGIFLVWYPIRDATQRREVHARFRALGIPKMLSADLAIHPDDAALGLAGSGLLLINAPYGLEEHLRSAYGALHDVLASPGAGYVAIEPLTPERGRPMHDTRTHHGP
ncbi:MAG TPA: 23S rRNA (adenine(2030)-N(6))-methyltransferase RlmJ [Steroidobacteraceae bacterium]|nr:23S rRNA (adenine(2030)-N(6))-methyltransferase RlmJ [Steroidobacteraceae bacterium]